MPEVFRKVGSPELWPIEDIACGGDQTELYLTPPRASVLAPTATTTHKPY